mgnify:FL=1
MKTNDHGLCAVCWKPDRGFGWSPRLKGVSRPDRWFCSREHLKIWREKKMDWNEEENTMILEAGKSGGQYLDSIGITDLRALDKGQWLMFLRSVIGRSAELNAGRRAAELNDDIPF